MTDPIVIDPGMIQTLVEQAVQQNIMSAVASLEQDPVWLEKIENMINQAVVLETIARIGSMDINTVVRQRVDENMRKIRQDLVNNFASTGISDLASSCQLTITDSDTVVENRLVASEVTVVNGITIKDLAVTGSINTDNAAWITLADNISNSTLAKVNDTWRDQLVQQVVAEIGENGIDFSAVNIGGSPLVTGNQLSQAVTESNLQSVGVLNKLSVTGDSHLGTVHVINRRLGINTDTPESALSVWDEEVSVVVGKHKSQHAYIGTARDQSLSLGINRTPYLDIDNTGLTTVRKLQIGVHKISHSPQVPGWAGTKGDVVFNADPKDDRVFAWVCTGGFNWQSIKGAE
jgi:hypothetical protein